ncbi:MAG: TonB-dependent receptor [Deltaproteobacteria bacterium]|nr:TonB-dependent receptor [Deltaproteobacteria bacterium]
MVSEGNNMTTIMVRNGAAVCIVVAILAGSWFHKAAAEETGAAVTLEEVVVTATRTGEVRRDVPNSVIVRDARDIEESPAASLGEFLANETGLDWRSYGNYGGAVEEIHIRGMGGDATQVFVNGVSVNSPSVGVADVARIPLDSIEKIEVVKGSGSVLYGSGAMGGTVHIMTRMPERGKTDLAVKAGYGSESSSLISARQGMYLTDNLGYYLSAGIRETDGFRSNSDLAHHDGSLRINYDAGSAFNIDFYGDYLERDYGRPGPEPPSGTGDFNAGGVHVYSSDAASLLNRGGDRDAHLIMHARYAPLNALALDVKGYRTLMKNRNYLRYFNSFTGDVPGSDGETANRVWGADGTLEANPAEGLRVIAGAEWRDYDWRNESVALDGSGHTIAGTELSADADLSTKGIFTELQYRPFQYGKILAGIRHEDHSAFGYENVPRVGLVVNPADETVIKLSHGKHFRAPTPNDLYWPDDGYSRGNPSLEPETGWHTEATLEQSCFNDLFFLTFSFFHWRLDNKIQWGVDSSGVWTPQNLRTYRAQGFEGEVTFGPVRHFMASLSYTYTDAREENRAYTKQDFGWPPLTPPDFQYAWVTRRAAYTPRQQFKGALTYETGFGLTASSVVRFVGDRPWYRTETEGAYPSTKTVEYTLDPCWTTDVMIRQRISSQWILSLDAVNIFDKGYATYYDIFFDKNGNGIVGTYPGPERSFFVSLSYEL